MNKKYILVFFLILGTISLSGCTLGGSKTSPVQPEAGQAVNVQENTDQGSATAEADYKLPANDQNNVQTEESVSSEKTFSMEEVQSANSAEKCWTTINGNVYDLTTYIDKHKGGPDKILSICGKDGRSAFTNQHGGQEKPEMNLAKLLIGKLK